MKLISSLLCGAISAFFLISFLVYVPSVSSFLMLLCGILLLPIKPWRKLLKEKLKLSGWLKGLLCAVLFVVAACTLPSSEPAVTLPETEQTTVVTTTKATVETITATTSQKTTAAPQASATTKATTTSTAKVTSSTTTKATTTAASEVSTATTTTATTTATTATSIPSTFSVHFIDVGQADAALVECDGEYMLIDGGNKADSNVIYSVLKREGIKNLAIVVGSHAHEDHIGGIPGAFNYTTADLTLCPVTDYDSDAFGDFAAYAKKNGNGITVPEVGDSYSLGSAVVHILGANGGGDTNDTSIILKIQYGDTSFLFTGDAEREAEQAVLNSGADLSATVLKIGHHGSETSTTYPFLREIMPQHAVISVGKDNSYGHPKDDVLSRLHDADVEVYRTDLHGDIVFTSDGTAVSVSTEKSAKQEDVFRPGSSVVTSTKATTAATTASPATTAAATTTATTTTTTSQPQSMSYILNTNTKKFHEPTCRSVKQMKEKNKQAFTGSRDEVIARGYKPCGNCHP